MISLTLSDDKYLKEIQELVFPFNQRFEGDITLLVDYVNNGREMSVNLASNRFENFSKAYHYAFYAEDELEKKRKEKRFLKMSIYGTLSFLTGINLPYGCLTGIRPTKLYFEIENERGKYGKTPREVFMEDYSVNGQKVALIEHVVNVQRTLRNQSENCFDVFVFIPFCPSRCAYCSFVSQPIAKQMKLLQPYAECLCRELELAHKLIDAGKLEIRSVYVGGGTPTSLPAALLDKILAQCHFGVAEFTVEAGRPDTITPEIVKVLKKHKVSRVSVNPQTFNDKTLEKIGRKHTAEDIESAYKRVRNKFDVNMDLIAMLPDESFEDFKFSVDKAISLNPENITVHTLYMKKGSPLKRAEYENSDFETAEAMVNYAYEALSANGYLPYYMYRQKYTCGNLENVGYAKPGKECIYNIDVMEEDTSILACGANAISKKWTKTRNLIERNANFKEPFEYIKRFDTVLAREKEFWDFRG